MPSGGFAGIRAHLALDGIGITYVQHSLRPSQAAEPDSVKRHYYHIYGVGVRHRPDRTQIVTLQNVINCIINTCEACVTKTVSIKCCPKDATMAILPFCPWHLYTSASCAWQ